MICAQVAELLLDEALPILKVLKVLGQDLDQGVVLVKSRLHLLLVAEDVAESRRQLGATLSVEDDLGRADVGVS